MLPVSVINPYRGSTFLFGPNFSWYNNCGPISQLSKCVEIMLFDVVFIEKNAKDKNAALRKISYVISSQWEHFGAQFKLIWETTVKGYNFCFSIFRNWSCDQQPMAWTLTHRIIMILYFLTFWSYISFWFSAYNVLVTIFGNVHRPYRHYFIIATTVFIMSIFFPHFLALFTSVTILGNVHRRCKQCINTIKRVYMMSILFLLIFLDLVMIFAWITILEDVHRPCKQYTNIVENGLCHATPFFSDLFLMFWAYLHQLPY